MFPVALQLDLYDVLILGRKEIISSVTFMPLAPFIVSDISPVLHPAATDLCSALSDF